MVSAVRFRPSAPHRSPRPVPSCSCLSSVLRGRLSSLRPLPQQRRRRAEVRRLVGHRYHACLGVPNYTPGELLSMSHDRLARATNIPANMRVKHRPRQSHPTDLRPLDHRRKAPRLTLDRDSSRPLKERKLGAPSSAGSEIKTGRVGGSHHGAGPSQQQKDAKARSGRSPKQQGTKAARAQALSAAHPPSRGHSVLRRLGRPRRLGRSSALGAAKSFLPALQCLHGAPSSRAALVIRALTLRAAFSLSSSISRAAPRASSRICCLSCSSSSLILPARVGVGISSSFL